MATVTITAKKVSSPGYNRSGVVNSYQCGGTVNLSDVVYLDANNKVQAAIATASETGHALGIVVGISSQYGETSQAAGGWVDVCEHGPVNLGITSLVSGQMLWVSATDAGKLVDTAPTPSAYDFIVANAINSGTIFVRPGQTTPASV